MLSSVSDTHASKKQNMDNQGLLLRKKFLDEEIRNLQDKICNSPPGTLISRKNPDGSYSYSQSLKDSEGKKKEIYFRKDDTDMPRKLAEKGYAEARLKDALREKRVIERELCLTQNDNKEDRFLRLHPGHAELVIPLLRNQNPFAEQWAKQPYVRNKKYPEGLIYPTVIPGLNVRSKSEGDIISRFVHFGVPFRYEEEHVINRISFHPDFTCLNTETNQVFFWEHQGRWDDPKYVSRLEDRNIQFQKAGIIPWKNLIITTETATQPLDIGWVDHLIQFFLKSNRVI